MSAKRESDTGSALSRRRVLGGLGAIAASACGTSNSANPNGSASTGGSGAGGSGSGAPPGAGNGGMLGTSAAGSTSGGTLGTSGGAAGGLDTTSGGTTASGAGQGPFFIHELEKNDDVSLVRQDIRGRYNPSAAPGVEMHLHLRVLDATSTSCNQVPVPNVDVYIWHTDAQGFYSGFGARGGADEQKPDTPYQGVPSTTDLDSSDRFCRGVQTTDANGVVSFRSIFPGWYNGRDLHVHFVAFKKGSTSAGRVAYTAANSGGKWLFTTQFYFEPAFSHSIHEHNEPYLTRTTLPAYAGALAADEPNNSGLRAKCSLSGASAGVGGIVTAQMQILLDPRV